MPFVLAMISFLLNCLSASTILENEEIATQIPKGLVHLTGRKRKGPCLTRKDISDGHPRSMPGSGLQLGLAKPAAKDIFGASGEI